MPDAVDVVITVPYDDLGDLTSLARELETGLSPIESRSLDGATTAAALVAVATTSIPVLRAWLVARLDAKKGSVVSFEGVKLQGYSANEVEKIVKLLRRELGDGVASESDDESDDAGN